MKTNDFQFAPVNFEEAIRFFREKVPMTDQEFQKLQENAKHRAFTVAGVTRLDLLQDILDELRSAIESGRTIKDFQKNVRGRMADKGWQGLTPYRLDTIFRTNVQTAYMVGRYEQMKSPAALEMRPYWLYVAVKDHGTRPSHLALDGMVRRHDDPFWEEWYPPNGFNCRCKVIPLSAEAVQRRGLKISEGELQRSIDYETGEILQMEPDKGFSRNVGQDAFEPNLERFDPDVKRTYLEKEQKGTF